MNLEFYTFIFGLMIIPFSFLFFPKIYYKKNLVIPFFIIVFIIALIGLFIFSQTINKKPNFYLFLLCPLFSLTFLRVQLFIFNKLLKRNPKNPPKNVFLEDDGLGWDRFFYFVFMVLSLITPIVILGYYFK